MGGRGLAGDAPIRVCFPFVGDDVGGSHISALKLVGGLDRDRFDPVVVLQRTDGPLAALMAREGMGYEELPLPETLAPDARSVAAIPTYLARSLPRIRRYLRRGRFDIVHTNDGRVHVNWGIAARLSGARLVWHHRGDPDAKGANLVAPFIASRMVTVSRFARPASPLLALDGRLDVIHSPFDHPRSYPDRDEAKAALLDELGFAPGTRVLGYFGGLIERKCPILFVDIVHEFKRKHPDIPVVGCLFGVSAPGGPDFEAAVRVRAEALGIGDAIALMGFRRPVEPYMAATDILLVPALGEPFGRTLIEAMFLGTPVVATDHGGNPEAIESGRNGFLVEPRNAAAFVAPIARLLRDPALFAEIASTARATALRSYSVAGHVAEVMDVYDSAFGRRQRARAGQSLTDSTLERTDTGPCRQKTSTS